MFGQQICRLLHLPSTNPLMVIGLVMSSLPASVMPSRPPFGSSRTVKMIWCKLLPLLLLLELAAEPYTLLSMGGGRAVQSTL